MVEFTKLEALDLRKFMIGLIKNNRIFLAYKHNITDKKLFEVVRLQKSINDIYKNTQAEATVKIRKLEKFIKLKSPNLKEGQTVVKCSNYSEGLEITAAYPLTTFLAFAPASDDDLWQDIFHILYPGGTDSIAPNYLDVAKEKTSKIYELILLELRMLKQKRDASVIIVKTLFSPGHGIGMKNLKDITEDFVNSPNALAYLFYKKEISNRTVANNFILFDVDDASRIQIDNLLGYIKPRISFKDDRDSGFDCPVLFALVT